MSKTDAHDPYWVQGIWQAIHDHRNGICNLPKKPANWQEAQRSLYSFGDCYWTKHPYSVKWKRGSYWYLAKKKHFRRTNWKKEIDY